MISTPTTRFFRVNILLILSIFFINISCESEPERIDLTSKDFLRLKTILENGYWAWDNNYCKENPQTIAIDIDKKTMTLILKNLTKVRNENKDTFVYNIRWAWKNGFRGKIIGEKGLDINGEPVEWDLFVVDDNRFYWRRNDWRKNSGSKTIIKCSVN
ncbi:MAG: hypothetical protein JXQ93_08920 [Flavobacteriaceae bacterium]